MGELLVARRYSHFIMDVALSSHVGVERVCMDVRAFLNLLNQSKRLNLMMMSKSMPSSVKARIWRKVGGDVVKKLGLSSITSNLISLLIENARSYLIKDIAVVLPQIWLEHQGIEKVILAIPRQVSDKVSNELKSYLEKAMPFKSTVDLKVDPDILEGFMISWRSKVGDFSTQGKINRLRSFFGVGLS